MTDETLQAHDERSPFEQLMAEVMATADRFGYRRHVHLTWLAVRRYGTDAAVDVVGDGIQHTARYAGKPQKYHATVSRAWVELVGHHADVLHAGRHPGQDRLGAARPGPFPLAAGRRLSRGGAGCSVMCPRAARRLPDVPGRGNRPGGRSPRGISGRRLP
ncbi:hypothetical protein [Streptomyces sp. BR123]|uniref:hypothetical protein n=1 Tax=Streptomyces sp. BR123 TaxID=2749828 RepID=UPI001C4EB0DC|nr:hypothetical protein [Streptomyces sp. BR123]